MTWHLNHARYGNKPWDVQLEAASRSAGHAKYGYFLEQGLGKTALALNDFVERNDTDLMLVLAPNSFKLDWKLAPAEWGLSNLPAGTWPKDPITEGVYSINYEAVRTSASEKLIKLLEKRDVMLVIDESSAIKNPQSLTSKAVVELAKRAKVVRELNGTPIVQNVMDYYAQLRCLGELNGVNPYQFRNRFARMGGFMGKQIVGMQNQEELYTILNRCSFRALKTDWRDLPPKVYTLVRLEMTTKQRVHYREMMEDFFTIVGGMEVEASMVLTQMDKLRQISSCLALQGGIAAHFEIPANNPKVKALFDIHNSGLGKTIVVHHYRASGRMLQVSCEAAGIKSARIAGQMKPDELLEEKRRYNEDPECRVLIGQESATCRGHTLIGGEEDNRCTRMVFFENSFSLLERLQMEDRIHRGEQDQECQYFDLVTSPMDQVVIDILTGKKEMANSVDAVVAAVRQLAAGQYD